MNGIRWWRIGEPEAGALEHRGRHLDPGDGPGDLDGAPFAGTSIWMEGNDGENELNFQRTLFLRRNLPFLRELAGITEDMEPVFAAREIGGAGSVDVAVLFRDKHHRRPQTLVLIDCKDAKPHGRTGLVQQCAQAYRLAQAAFPNLDFDPPLMPDEVRLVLISGMGRCEGLPAEITSMPRPGWCIDGEFVAIPEPIVHVYLPVAIKEMDGREQWLAVQRLAPTMASSDLWRAAWAATARRLNSSLATGKYGARHDFHFLAVGAREHLKALGGMDVEGSDAKAIRALLRDGRAAVPPGPGWQFAGETNDKGFVRLWWKREPEARMEDLESYLRRVGLSTGRLDRAGTPRPADQEGARR